MIRAVLMSFVVTASMAQAAPSTSVVQKVDLEKDLKSSGFVNLYENESVKKAGKLSPLAQLKSFEIQLKWNQCAELAPKVLASQKDVRGWVALTWLHCLAQVKPSNAGAEARALSTIGKSKELFQEGPWAQELWQTWASRELDRLEAEVKNKNKSAEQGIELLLDRSSELTKDQRSE